MTPTLDTHTLQSSAGLRICAKKLLLLLLLT